MTEIERDQVLLTARLLRAAGRVDWLSTAVTTLAIAALLFRPASWIMASAILIGLVEKYYGVRVAFDARLFEDIAAERLTTAGLDQALAASGLSSPYSKDRPWPERCRGARRLVTMCIAATIAQCLVVVMIVI